MTTETLTQYMSDQRDEIIRELDSRHVPEETRDTETLNWIANNAQAYRENWCREHGV